MSFTEIAFLPFLLTVLALQDLLRGRHAAQVWMLLVASYVFYSWWNVSLLGLIVFSSVLDFVVGGAIHRSQSRHRRKALLILSLVCNLGLLAIFKYTNFFIEVLNVLMASSGVPAAPLEPQEIPLPVGISFYTFQTLSYSLDIYRGDLKPEPSPVRFFFFVAAFPQLVAGPIVRARTLLPQIRGRFSEKRDTSGLFLILYGLFKKLLLADVLGSMLIDGAFSSPERHDRLTLLLALYAYSFQIFLDFSAYTDIAIGTGRLLGLQMPQNFRAPYLATSLSEFWKRWHITLTSWFRDYVYIPLGGNRVSRPRWIVNVLVVFLLSGLWHGAKMTFVVWGAIHGLVFIAELAVSTVFARGKAAADPGAARSASPVTLLFRGLIIFHVVTLAWAFFRSTSVAAAMTYLSLLVEGAGTSSAAVTPAVWLSLAVAVVLHLTVEPRVDAVAGRFQRWPVLAQAASFLALGAACFYRVDDGMARQAFIYFQF